MLKYKKPAAVLVALTLLAAACGGDDDAATTTTTAAPAATTADAGDSADTTVAPAEPAMDIRVGLAYDIGGRGDGSFNDAAAAGLDRAAAELGVTTAESSAHLLLK